jgi:hypothetical protein
MGSVRAIARRLLMIVALFATMHGLLHTHSIDAPYTDHTSTAAQNCVLCVSAQSSLGTAPVRIAPPVSQDVAEPRSTVAVSSRVAEACLSSRAPPRV